MPEGPFLRSALIFIFSLKCNLSEDNEKFLYQLTQADKYDAMSYLSVFRDFWEPFKNNFKKCRKNAARKRIHYLCEDMIEKSVLREAKRKILGTGFSIPPSHSWYVPSCTDNDRAQANY